MSEFILKKASKRAKKLRIACSASSGSGKTYSSLLIAFGLVGDWNKICVIDSEKESAGLYSDLGEYNTMSISKPYSPERYIAAIRQAEQAGMEVIIIDSISHEWSGAGGCLDIHAALGGTFKEWSILTPMHQSFIDAILDSSSHVICTIRRKEEHTMSKNENGKNVVQKLGLQEVTRDGFSYEMDVVFEIENDTHLAKSTKDRTGMFDGKNPFLITKETGSLFKEWCESGRSLIDDAMEMIRKAKDKKDLDNIFRAYPSLATNEDFKTSLRKKNESFIESLKGAMEATKNQ